MSRHRPSFVVGLLIAWMLVAGGRAGAADAPRTKLTIAAYNVENLFDVFDDPYTDDEETRVKPLDEIKQIAKALRKLDADVVAFEELENEGVLRQIVRQFLGDMGYRYIATSRGNSNRGISVAVMSRVPIYSITTYRYLELKLPGDQRTWHFARDLLRVRLQVTPKRTADVFVVHLKSKRTVDRNDPQSASWRLAEATMVRTIINKALKADPNAWIVLTGDFNDTPDSAPIKALLNKENGAPTLTDVHAALPADQRITYLKKPYRSTIDYVLVSPALAKRQIKDSARVISGKELLGGSDHAPVVASFDLRDE